MLDFHVLELADRSRVTAALEKSRFMGCEYSFANNLAWRRLDDTQAAFFGGFYISCGFGSGKPVFAYPSGEGDVREVISEMRSFAENRNAPLVIVAAEQKALDALEKLFPGQFTAFSDRDSANYIYNSADLISLPGRKFHAKRNHLARFRETGCTFSLITEKDFDDAIVFLTETYNGKADTPDKSMIAEQFALNTFFNHFYELGLQGGIIRQEGIVKAVTIGEPITPDTYCVHIEKADVSVPGIYAGINNCFAESAARDFTYINREEDLGLEGLRKAKLSYNPAFLLDKYVITFK